MSHGLAPLAASSDPAESENGRTVRGRIRVGIDSDHGLAPLASSDQTESDNGRTVRALQRAGPGPGSCAASSGPEGLQRIRVYREVRAQAARPGEAMAPFGAGAERAAGAD